MVLYATENGTGLEMTLDHVHNSIQCILSTELTEMDGQKEEVSKLEQELADAEHRLRLESDKEEGMFNCKPLWCIEYTVVLDLHSDLKKTGIEQESKAKHLEEEKNACSQKFSKDPEFIRSACFH